MVEPLTKRRAIGEAPLSKALRASPAPASYPRSQRLIGGLLFKLSFLSQPVGLFSAYLLSHKHVGQLSQFGFENSFGVGTPEDI
jgi:hypothetical protein